MNTTTCNTLSKVMEEWKKVTFQEKKANKIETKTEKRLLNRLKRIAENKKANVEALQHGFSNCYDEMLEYLRETGCFNEAIGLNEEGFSIESTNELGQHEFFTEYGLDPSIPKDWITSHFWEDDYEWKEVFEEYLHIQSQAKVLGVELIFCETK